MSIIIKFANGFAAKESDKITYFIPNYASSTIVPVDLTVLEVADLHETKETGRKYYEAYKANITTENLETWKIPSAADNDVRAVSLKEALNGQELYDVQLKTSTDNQPRLDFRRVVDKKKTGMGVINLEKVEIVPSVGRLLETVIVNLQETAEENRRILEESAVIKKKQVELETTLKELTMAKFQMEDKLSRAFHRCLNTKKQRIVKLEKEIEALKSNISLPAGKSKKEKSSSSTRSRMSTLMGVSSSDSEGEKLSNQDATTDYDSETDVHDSDDDGKNQEKSRLANKDKVQKQAPEPKLSALEDKPKPAGCRKNLFPIVEETPPVPASSRPRRSKASYSQGNDSQTDSSQEFFIPKPKSRKVQSILPVTNRLNQLKNKSNAAQAANSKAAIIDDESSEKSEEVEEEKSESEPKSKKSRSDEESRLITPSPDNDDILNQIFDFD